MGRDIWRGMEAVVGVVGGKEGVCVWDSGGQACGWSSVRHSRWSGSFAERARST